MKMCGGCDNFWPIQLFKLFKNFIRFDKIDGFIRIYDGTRYLTLFVSENMIPFTIKLDIL